MQGYSSIQHPSALHSFLRVERRIFNPAIKIFSGMVLNLVEFVGTQCPGDHLV